MTKTGSFRRRAYMACGKSGTRFSTKNAAMLVASVFVSIVALTGCKKEPSNGSPEFYFNSDSEIFFEYGQTKNISFHSYKALSFSVTDFSREWSATVSGNKLAITAPTMEDIGNQTGLNVGNIDVTAKMEDGSEIMRALKVYVNPALNLNGPANSFIVSIPDQRYRFEMKKGDGSALQGIAKATLMWTTNSEDAISHVVLEDDGHISFSTGGWKATGGSTANFLDANALIAAVDGDGKVVWSWHIWATGDDPRGTTITLGGIRVMDRNLGASANSAATPEELLRSYGLFYQWGRKDPFVGPMEWDSTTPQSMYNSAGQQVTHSFVISDATLGTIDSATANPMCFIAGTEGSQFDWLFAARDNSLWSINDQNIPSVPKSLYDPCPAGWRVASNIIWKGFLNNTDGEGSASDQSKFNVDGDYDGGWNFKTDDGGTTFFPAAGRRSFSPTLASVARNYTNVVHNENGDGFPVGFYWASCEQSAGNTSGGSPSLEFRDDFLSPTASSHRAGGFPVRCMKED